MKLSTVTLVLAAASSVFAGAALAQSRFCIGGNLDQLTASQRATCAARVQAVRNAASLLHAPSDWHFVVVCGEEGWNDYVAYSGESNAAFANGAAHTTLEQHETFFREARLDLNDARSLEQVVAHELAAIVLHSEDELAINRQVDLWMAQAPTAHGL